MEKTHTQTFPRLVSMEMVAIFDFRALTKVHIYLQNRFFKCSENVHTHRRHINEETYRSVFTFVEYYIFNLFFWKNTHKKLTFQICLGENIMNNVLRNFLQYFF